MYSALRNKKIMEISYVFFSKFCSKFYVIPPFYHLRFDSLNRVMRYQFYDTNHRELAVMMGTIALLLNYFSKLFNIPLKYSLFVNGSRSFIVKDKKEYLKFNLALYRYTLINLKTGIPNLNLLALTCLIILTRF
jgi:hypothetical protein